MSQKPPTFIFLNNSVKNQQILTILAYIAEHREET